jgi:hypothetical protein
LDLQLDALVAELPIECAFSIEVRGGAVLKSPQSAGKHALFAHLAHPFVLLLPQFNLANQRFPLGNDFCLVTIMRMLQLSLKV